MNNFLTELDVRYIDGKRWEIREDFTYRLGAADGVEYVTIGRGFVTDFASMPLNVIFRSPGGKWDKPAVIHDCLYKTEHVMVTGAEARKITREEADDIFNEAMKVTAVGWQRRFIYAGVRVGGWLAWNKHREAHEVQSRT